MKLVKEHARREQSKENGKNERYQYEPSNYSTANSATGTATNAVVCSSNHNEAHKSAQKGSIHYKQDKILLIRQTHAVIYPGTVMIHFYYAPLAHAAMMSSRGFEILAANAFSLGQMRMHRIRIKWNSARIRKHCSKMTTNGQKGKEHHGGIDACF
eukprot:gb/GECG01001085.1/.p1 GENE.gb/GECG01001085.1/~~gb/GECG01001085.1/.p1  ORF type:complete len:156 (+),score=16.33 gb/GECG01001085.1/:1-468(+)